MSILQLANYPRYAYVVFAVVAMLGTTACGAIISPYDVQAYKNATDIKAQAIIVVSKATESYSQHANAAENLMLNVNQAFEYSAGMPRNKISTEQWRLIKDPSAKLLGGFIEKWKASTGLSTFFVDQATDGVSKAFDYVICLEANKKEATACSAP